MAVRTGAMAVLLGALALPLPAGAHGLWGHIHVTGWAVENMPDDDLRAFLYDDPEVFNALLFGAVFADSGYSRDEAGSRAYSEHAHWEPFVEDYVQWILENDPPPWNTLESKKRVAFLLGCASHGMQDSIFDSLFLSEVEERDGAGQDATDPGTDGFLVADGHVRFIPEEDVPMDTLLELFADVSPDITREVIDAGVGLTTAAYINEEIGLGVAETFAERYADVMPWGREHYLDPEVPGSLRAEIYPTMRYQQALWKRLHDGLAPDDVTVFAYPDQPRRLRSGTAGTVASWVTLVFGEGVRFEGDLVELFDDAGASVPFTLSNTRWGATHTRLVRIRPDEDLVPGGWYTARLRAGVELIDGGVSSESWEVRFQVACDTADDPACPELGEVDVPWIDGIPEPEPEVEEETGCGCATTGSAGWMPLVALPLWWRRRRD
ncbi:MAG: hypothetical protein EP330_05965 [Deltaproteobacteria bacterium]|nr:MAG: hypothetical protein EP330_05965 [Deltaproteobacteria bacterium]